MHHGQHLQLGAAVSASASANISSDPAETLARIEGGAPEIEQIKAEWKPAMDAAGKFKLPIGPDGQIDRNRAVEVMMRAMPLVLSASGMGGSAAQIAAIAQGVSPELNALISGNAKPLGIAALKLGAAYGCQAVGIPPQVGMVTIEALKDGELTDKDFEAAGAVGGSIGGAAICAVIGIPPCIGGFAGAFVGEKVGAIAAGALKIGGGKAEREARRQKQLAEQAAIRGQLNALRDQFANMIMMKRGEWWAFFDHVIDNMSLQWQSLECNMAASRFPLLWQPSGSPSPWFVYPYSGSTCTLPINRNLSRGTGCLTTKTVLPYIEQRGGICAQPYGCPYPTFPPLGEEDQWNERVVQAFAAYDIWWVPQQHRQKIDELWVNSLPKPDDRPPGERDRRVMGNYTAFIAQQTSLRAGCKSDTCRGNSDRAIRYALELYKSELEKVAVQALSFEAINGAAMRISGDLMRTAGIYAAAMQINADRSAALTGNVGRLLSRNKNDAEYFIKRSREVEEARRTGKILNAITNYGPLALGGALLGGAILKRSR